MARDSRYKTLKVMLETGNIVQFSDIFNVVPKTVVAADLGINYVRFIARVQNPGDFLLSELVALAELIETNKQTITNLAIADIENKKSRKRKNT